MRLHLALMLLPLFALPQSQERLLVKNLRENVRVQLLGARVSQARTQALQARFAPVGQPSQSFEITFPAHSHTPLEKSLINMIRSSVHWESIYDWNEAILPLILSMPKDVDGRVGSFDSFFLESYGVPRSMNEETCQREVEELHQFFEDWFIGRLESNDEAFARFGSVMGEEFAMVTPDGRTIAREALLPGLRSAYGKDKETFRIEVRNVRSRKLAPTVWMVSYEEWQTRDGVEKGRVSTALMRENPESPNGLIWIHVHETWL